jgi:hypothetical protein
MSLTHSTMMRALNLPPHYTRYAAERGGNRTGPSSGGYASPRSCTPRSGTTSAAPRWRTTSGGSSGSPGWRTQNSSWRRRGSSWRRAYPARLAVERAQRVAARGEAPALEGQGAGSGAFLWAAYLEGRRALGFEIDEERYAAGRGWLMERYAAHVGREEVDEEVGHLGGVVGLSGV